MSITKAAPAPAVQLTPSTAARQVGAVASALFAVALFMTVAAVDVPHDATDAALLQWWQQSGNRMSGLVSGISATCAAVLFAVVMNYICSLGATVKAPQWRAFARSMAAAVTALWLVTGAARAVISHLVDVMDEPLPGTDVLRFATAFNYTLLGQAGMCVLGLSILAVSDRGAAHRRTRSVGRLRRTGVRCGHPRRSDRPVRGTRDTGGNPVGAQSRGRDLASAAELRLFARGAAEAGRAARSRRAARRW